MAARASASDSPLRITRDGTPENAGRSRARPANHSRSSVIAVSGPDCSPTVAENASNSTASRERTRQRGQCRGASTGIRGAITSRQRGQRTAEPLNRLLAGPPPSTPLAIILPTSGTTTVSRRRSVVMSSTADRTPHGTE